ncbi:MAG TPA: type II toxin-antitoxin system HicB family antitoxin [Nitrospira sp.]|nr:type II toxin-antitoxin system HicB family antitoxin [Nitrospira sp.]
MPTTATKLTLEYWKDADWYVGQLREMPGVISQGATLKELEENIQDAYQLMIKEHPAQPPAGEPKPN